MKITNEFHIVIYFHEEKKKKKKKPYWSSNGVLLIFIFFLLLIEEVGREGFSPFVNVHAYIFKCDIGWEENNCERKGTF